MHRGPPGKKAHPEVAAIPIISAEEVTSPNSQASEPEAGSSTLNLVVQASDLGRQDPGHRHNARTRMSGAAVTCRLGSELQANLDSRKDRFSSPRPATDPDNHEPDLHPIVLVPDSSDPNLANRANADPNNRTCQSPSPPPLPSPRLLFVRSRPCSLGPTQEYGTSAVDSDVQRDPGGTNAFGPPITVSTQLWTSDNNGDVDPGGLKLNDVMNLEGRREAENVDQNRSGAGSRIGSQDPAETSLLGNVQDCIGHSGVNPHNAAIVWESNTREGDDGIRQSPAANLSTDLPDRVQDLKPMKPLMSSFDRLTVDARRVESAGARSKLQAEVEGDEEHTGVVGASKGKTNTSGPPHSTSFPPLGRMLSLLDEAGPSRSLGGLGKAITRRPRRPIARRGFSKAFQTQPDVEVENGWESEGPLNVNARSGAGVSKSDDLSYFAGL